MGKKYTNIAFGKKSETVFSDSFLFFSVCRHRGMKFCRVIKNKRKYNYFIKLITTRKLIRGENILACLYISPETGYPH
jgi:hypothetical protein